MLELLQSYGPFTLTAAIGGVILLYLASAVLIAGHKAADQALEQQARQDAVAQRREMIRESERQEQIWLARQQEKEDRKQAIRHLLHGGRRASIRVARIGR